MSALGSVALVACVFATVLAGLRWLRVAQREHYLARTVVVFVFRWWARSPGEVIAGLLGLIGACVSIAYPVAAIATAGAIGIYPIHLGVRGRSARLVWTRRLRTLACVGAGLCALVIVLSAVFGGVGPSVSASAFVALATPFFIALALVISAPAEDALAQRYVKRAKERIARVRPTIVGITGSFGKTSTKGYLEHLLAARFDVVASPRSFNNRAGLALAVNEHLLDGTDVFIAEMGAYGSGEIAALCAWLPPTVAVISAIGPVHLERFKTLDRILQAKVEILAHAEVAVLNVDDERLSLLAEELLTADRKVLRCSGNNLDADVIVRLDNAYLELIVDSAEVGRIACEGQRQTLVATNVACAVGAALALGCEPLELLERLGGLPVAKSRLEVSRANNGAMVLDDTFNANPAGVRRALSELASLGQPGKRRVVVTPGMVELGEKQLSENAEFAKRAAGVATDIVIVGKTNRRALRQGITTSSRELARARDASRSVQGLGETEPLHVLEVRTRDQAVAYVRDILGAGDVVLYENDLPDHYP